MAAFGILNISLQSVSLFALSGLADSQIRDALDPRDGFSTWARIR